MANAWVPPVVLDVDWKPDFADGPIGVSALFRESRPAAVVQSHPFDFAVESTASNYFYLDSRRDTFTRLHNVEKECGLAAGALLAVERQRISTGVTTNTKHTVDIVFSVTRTLTNNSKTPITFQLTPESHHLLSTSEATFQDNHGYYFVSSQIRRSSVTVVYHIEASSNTTAAWTAMQAHLDVQGGNWTPSTLTVAVASVRETANVDSDMTISMRVVSSGTGIGTERRFDNTTSRADITDAFTDTWLNANLQSQQHSQPYKARLTSYRAGFPHIPWAGTYAGVSGHIEAQIRLLKFSLDTLRDAVAVFPSPGRQTQLRAVLNGCEFAFDNIKETIRAAPTNPNPDDIGAMIGTAVQDCSTLSNDVVMWQIRYDYILSLIRERQSENPFGGWTGLRKWVPCHASHERRFGHLPPAGCPYRNGDPIDVVLSGRIYEHRVDRELPFDTNIREIVLGYTIRARKEYNNGYWRTNKPILVCDSHCTFQFSNWAWQGINFSVEYRVASRSDYDFPELLDPIHRVPSIYH